MKIFGNAMFEIAESDRILRPARELRREASSFSLREQKENGGRKTGGDKPPDMKSHWQALKNT